MACLPGLPLPFVGGVALAVQIVGVSERYGPSCGTEQTSAPPRNRMAHGLTTAGGAVRIMMRLWNVGATMTAYSALMLAARITLAHFLVYVRTKSANSAGEVAKPV